MDRWRHFLDRHGGLNSRELVILSELIMATQAELDAKLDQIAAKVDALIAAAGQPPAPVPVTQAELDADVAKADAILAKQ